MSDTQNTPITENEHVKELLTILRGNGFDSDAQGLSELVGHFAAMEREVGAAARELANLRRELGMMRDERAHPLRTMLKRSADGLAAKLNAVRSRLSSLKDKIIGMCKSAVEAFKDKGVEALNNFSVSVIKPDLIATRDAISEAMEYNHRQISKIDKAAEQYHTAGRAVRNVGRALQGKEPVPGIKPNGTLARIAEAPFRSELRRLNRSLGRTGKALATVDRLEKAAERRAGKNRPSTLDNMRELRVVVDQRKKEAPAAAKEKQTETAI
jgi:hypothetical protein